MTTAVLLAAAPVLQAQSAAATPERFIGLWASESMLAPLVAGTLTIDARGTPWHADVAGREGRVARRGDTVQVTLPGGGGRFIGRRTADGTAIRGHWVQPAVIPPYGQEYASPVHLSREAAGVWSGAVRPLEPRMTFFLVIARGDSGRVEAYLRNPEANYFADRRYTVRVAGDSLALDHPRVPEGGTYDAEHDQLQLPLLFGYPPLVFSRRRGDLAGYAARALSAIDAPTTYRPPLTAGDGWAVANARDVGIDSVVILRFVDRVRASEPSPQDALNIHSLLIARHGKLVVEEYFHGQGRDRLHDMRSASKSITSVLVGIAEGRGVPIHATTPVASLLGSGPDGDARRARVTVADLLDMTSGLDIDDASPSSLGEEGRLWSQREQPDFCRYAWSLPMVRDPGSRAPVYGSASTNLAGCALRAASGEWLPDFFDAHFATPLDIREYAMNLMPNGEAYAGGGLYLRPRDQLKLGQLYLARGVWNGRRVVPVDWVRRSTVRVGDMKPRIPADTGHGYGMAWHFRETTVHGARVAYYWAGGNGGQLILVVPQLDLVIGFTGGDYAQAAKYLRWEIEELPASLLPAVGR